MGADTWFSEQAKKLRPHLSALYLLFESLAICQLILGNFPPKMTRQSRVTPALLQSVGAEKIPSLNSMFFPKFKAPTVVLLWESRMRETLPSHMPNIQTNFLHSCRPPFPLPVGLAMCPGFQVFLSQLLQVTPLQPKFHQCSRGSAYVYGIV